MNPMRWEPVEAMDLMFNRFAGLFRFGRPELGTGEYFDWSPSTDISETDNEYLIRAALPAVNVTVTYENGVLTLSGERRQGEEQTDEKFHRVESYYGNFSRSFALPDVIDQDAIKAESKDGVLTIHVPKTQSEVKKLTTIKVQ